MGGIFEAIGSFLGAQEQADAVGDAADTSAEASRYATDMQYKMFKENLGLLKPFYESAYKMLPGAEKTALSAYSLYPSLLSQAQNYQTSPLTKLQLEEGTKTLNKQLASRGLYNSGAGLTTLRKYSQEVLANEADKQYNRLYSLLGLGMGQSTLGTGSSAASAAAAQGLYTGQGIANTTMANGVNQANALLSQGNIRSGMYSQLGKLSDKWLTDIFSE